MDFPPEVHPWLYRFAQAEASQLAASPPNNFLPSGFSPCISPPLPIGCGKWGNVGSLPGQKTFRCVLRWAGLPSSLLQRTKDLPPRDISLPGFDSSVSSQLGMSRELISREPLLSSIPPLFLPVDAPVVGGTSCTRDCIREKTGKLSSGASLPFPLLCFHFLKIAAQRREEIGILHFNTRRPGEICLLSLSGLCTIMRKYRDSFPFSTRLFSVWNKFCLEMLLVHYMDANHQ